MRREEIELNARYKITFPGSYRGRIAKARFVDLNGDVTLEFKNGRRVLYHASWLEDPEPNTTSPSA